MNFSNILNGFITLLGALFSGLEFILQSGLNTFNGLTGIGKVVFGVLAIALLLGIGTKIKRKFDKLPNE